jgi:hypothetical protein
MAKNVTVQVLGGQKKVFDEIGTLADIVKAFELSNPSIKINGKDANIEDDLADYSFVSLGEKVKGGK